MAVSTADISSATAKVTGMSSVTTPALTPDITTNANRAGMVLISRTINTFDTVAADIGGTAGSAVSGTSSGTSVGYSTIIYGVTAPPSGSQTATASWVGSANAIITAIATSGVDQTTPFNNGTFGFTAGSGQPSININSNAGDLTAEIECDSSGNSPTSPTQTQVSVDHVNTGNVVSAGVSRETGSGGIGVAGPITHAWTISPSGPWVSSGANFNQVAAVADAIGSANLTSSAGRFIGWTT